MYRGALILAFVVAGALAAPAFADAEADALAIRARLAAWVEAFNARDPEAACDLFAPDLRYAVPEVAEGTQATMCGNFRRVMSRTDTLLRYDPPAIHEIIVEGDLAVVRLTWTLHMTTLAGARTMREEGMDVFRRQPDGRWSIARFVAFTPEE